MPFTYPDDMSMNGYSTYEPARPHPPDDPLEGSSMKPAKGSHDHEDDSLLLKIEALQPVALFYS